MRSLFFSPWKRLKVKLYNNSHILTYQKMINQIIRQRYQIIKQLGSGGVGETYLAEDLNIPITPKPLWVVKRLQPKMFSPEIIRLFKQEAAVLYNLSKEHSQIPKLSEYFTVNEQFNYLEFYLIQEFIEGHDLTQEIYPGKTFTEGEAVKLLEEILNILQYVHSKGVIHRDLKPSNIMRRDRDQKLVLIDFGTVKEVGSLIVNNEGKTQSTIAIGTPGYMPSEQSMGRPNYSSDIYALGIILIEALTGLKPMDFPMDQNHEIQWRDRTKVSNYLGNIIDRMVRYDFRQRYPDVSSVMKDLNPLISSQSADTLVLSPGINRRELAPTIAPESHGLVSNSPKKLLIVSVGTALITVIIGWIVVNLGSSKNPQSVTLKTTVTRDANSSTLEVETNYQKGDHPVSSEEKEVDLHPTVSGDINQQRNNLPRLFPVNSSQEQLENTLGKPNRNSKGFYPNTRALLYTSAKDQVDLGYIIDQRSGLIKQSEAGFRKSVNLEVINNSISQMLGNGIKPEITNGLAKVHGQHQPEYKFTIDNLKGQIVRQNCGDIYVAIWESSFHDFPKIDRVNKC